MEELCAASCRFCASVLPDDELCYFLESGPDIWKPGDLDRMFRRIVNDPYFQQRYNVRILSSPEKKFLSVGDDEDEEEGGGEPKEFDGPWVIVMDDFLSEEETKRLIELGASEKFRQSELVEDGIDEETRTSTNSWCTESNCAKDEVAQRVLGRIFNMTQIDKEYSEDMQMLSYQTGQL